MRNQLTQLICSLVLLAGTCAVALDFPGPPPGPAKGSRSGSDLVLENGALEMRWSFAGGRIEPDSFTNKLSGAKLNLRNSEVFELVLGDTPMPGTRIWKASELHVAGHPEITEVVASPSAV